MSRRVQFVVGLLLALVLLAFFFRQADWAEVAASLRRADYRLVAVSVAASVAGFLLRAVRWKYLVMPLKRVGMGPLINATMIGWAVTALLPGRLGEVVRPVLLGQKEGISKSATVATVVLERLFDMLAILLLLGLYLLAFPLPTGLGAQGTAVMRGLRLSGALAVLALLLMVGLLVGLQVAPHRSERIVQRILGLLPRPLARRLFELLRAFLRGFDSIREPRLVAMSGAWTLVLWGVHTLEYWVLFPAFDIDVPDYAVLPLMVLIVVGVAVPTPAAVGSFHAAAQIGLTTLWAVPNDVAISYAIVSHAVAFVPVTIIGIVLMGREGMSLGQVSEMEVSEEPLEEESL